MGLFSKLFGFDKISKNQKEQLKAQEEAAKKQEELARKQAEEEKRLRENQIATSKIQEEERIRMENDKALVQRSLREGRGPASAQSNEVPVENKNVEQYNQISKLLSDNPDITEDDLLTALEGGINAK